GVRPEASVKFLGRAVRIATEAGLGSPVHDRPGPAASGNVALRKVTHKTIDEVTRLVESARLNVAVARLMELATAARRAIDSGPGAADAARGGAAGTLAGFPLLVRPF